MAIDISTRYIDGYIEGYLDSVTDRCTDRGVDRGPTIQGERAENVLELAILGLLTEQELHGYELKKRLADTLGLLASVSFGSLYPALARLEGAGAVVAVTPDTTEAGQHPSPSSRIPMTGSLGGERAAFRGSLPAEADQPGPGGEDPSAEGDTGAARPRRGQRDRRQRKVYRITEAGTALFGELLAGRDFSPDDDRGFALRLAFARHLSPDARLRLLERRRAVLAQRRERAMATPTGDTYRAALAQRRVEALDGDITWLDRLVVAERARSTAAPTEATASPEAPDPTGPGDPRSSATAHRRATTRKASA